jgi:hypothetical protein
MSQNINENLPLQISFLSEEMLINVSHTWNYISGSAYLLPFTEERDSLSTSPFVHRLTRKLVLKI